MWSWVMHRITGFLIFLFLLVHVLDTAMVRVSPETYNAAISTYQNWVMGFVEAGLVIAITLHAINGLRIVAVGFWSKGTKFQHQLLLGGAAVALVLMLPFVIVHLSHVFGSSPETPTPTITSPMPGGN
ncbi:MAG: succinate dehydrogenase, cytochrome b556 subunit [Micrococcales bacterium]|nr:succinate dehydrogenase, cytochrome b556 subunit [Micrococcales bacterium]